MLAIMIAFFGVIVAVNFTMAWFASKSWTGLVVESSYVASQDFNDNLELARQQAARGWQDEIAYVDGHLSLTLTDQKGEPVQLDWVQAKLGRPASEFADRDMVLTYQGRGVYATEHELAPGLWQLLIEAESGDAPLRLEARLYIRKDGRGELQ